MSNMEQFDLDTEWEHSTNEPRELIALDNPDLETGTYVIQPGERVPETGTTSHHGTEISVIHEGIIAIVVEGTEYEVGPKTLIAIQAGTEHYSENRGDEPVKLVYTVGGGL